MYYTIYKITNLLNGKIYIGKHETEKLDDNYFGSGILLLKAYKKYGRKNFKKEILFIFDNEVDMNKKEKEIITEDFVKRDDTYNLGIGGEGGPHFKGKTHSNETKEKLSKLSKNKPKYKKTQEQLDQERATRYNKNGGKWFSNETIEKIKKKKQDRKVVHTEESKRKISDAMKSLMTDDRKKEISEKMKEVYKSSQLRKKISQIMSGKKKNTIWIRNDATNHIIRIENNDLEHYINLGYRKGRFI